MIEVLTTIQRVLEDLHPKVLFRNRIAATPGAITAGDASVRLAGVAGITLLGLGKAAVAQVRAVRTLLAENLPPELVPPRAFAVTRHGHGESDAGTEVLCSAHPLPDASSRSAASELLWRARSSAADNLLILCLSGGGSALAVWPRVPFTLNEKLKVNSELLQAGASIDETNVIRRELSAIKNGGLLAASGARRVLTLITSDVPVDDLGVVASGPTIHRPLDPERVRAIARNRLSPILARRIETQLTGRQRRAWNAHLEAAAAEHASYVACVGDYHTLIDATRRRLAEAGYEHISAPAGPLDAPVETGLELHLREIGRLAREHPTWALVTGGELPIRVRGNGRGGRNTEFVVRLAKALWLDRLGAMHDEVRDRLIVAAVGTDGSDGPTAAAGGWLTREKLEQARAHGVGVDRALANNDTLTFLEALGCAIHTGPTHTNLMDLRIVCRT